MPIPVVPVPFVLPPAEGPFPLQIGDPLGLAALEAAPNGPLVLLWIRDPEATVAMDALAPVGLQVDIVHRQEIPGGQMVYVVPKDRVRVTEMKVDGSTLLTDVASRPVEVPEDRTAALQDLVGRYAKAEPSLPEALLEAPLPPLFNLFQFAFPMEGPARQEALELDSTELLDRVVSVVEARIVGLAGRAMETVIPAPEDDLGPYPEGERDAVLYELEQRVRTGLLDADEALGELEMMAEDLAEPLDEDLEALVRAAFDRQRDRQSGWERPTAAQRMLTAIMELDGALLLPGVARGGWFEEIDEDIEAALEAVVRIPDGVVLFTMQNAVAAASGRGLEIGFRTVPDNDPAIRQPFGARVLAALQEADLPVRWSGHADDPIHVDIPWHLPVT